MEKKQTVVEWLASNLGEHIIWEEKIIDLVEQAKAMHKEEIESAYFNGSADRLNDEGSFDEYYNETFGGEN